MKTLFCGFDFLGDLNMKFVMKCLLGIFFSKLQAAATYFLGILHLCSKLTLMLKI